MRLGIDVDGVLVDYPSAIEEVLAQQTGRHVPRTGHDTWPPRWDWLEDYYSDQEIEKAVRSLVDYPASWANMKPLDRAEDAVRRLNALARSHQGEVYFVTSRPGTPGVKHATERWLYQWGMHNPTVICGVASKGLLGKAMKFDTFVDDHAMNCMEMLGACPTTATYLIERPYNLEQRPQIVEMGGIVVPNLSVVMERLCNT